MPRKRQPARLWLEKRKGREPTYYILDGGRKISTGCTEARTQEAEEKFAEYIREKKEIPIEHRASKALIANILLYYTKVRLPELAVPNWEPYRLEKLADFWGDLRLSDVNGANCRKYVAWRKSEGVGPSARRELEVLQAAINLYHKEYTLDVVPVVTLPEKALPRQDWLTRQQAAKLLWAAWRRPESKHLARFILIAIYTGTRTGAILGLRWVESLDGGWIDLDREIMFRKGRRERETNKRRPPLRLYWRLTAHLRRWKRMDEALGLTYVITYRGKPINKLRRSWDQACEDAGLTTEAGFPFDPVKHHLRHTAATWLLGEGISFADTSDYLGMSEKVLRETYAHVHPNFHRNIAERPRMIANETARKTVNKT
jgi:integrase